MDGWIRIQQGYVEQAFDADGNCLDQSFQPIGGVDRRTLDDEPIEAPEVIEEIESKEKHFPFDMVQP